MKYKLINKTTGEEHICSKETVNDFDYYIGDVVTDIEHSHVWCKTETKFHPYLPFIGNTNYAIEEFEKGNFLKVIATNNPDKKIPKVVDEVEEMAKEVAEIEGKYNLDRVRARINFLLGYKKSQETHPFSENDIVEFFDWCNFPIYRGNGEFGFRTRVVAQFPDYNTYTVIDQNGNNCLPKGKFLTTKELFRFWKDQQIKTVYYE